MTTINRVTKTNPRGAGRKPKAPADKKLKTSVSLMPETASFLKQLGADNLSKGIELLVERAKNGKRHR